MLFRIVKGKINYPTDMSADAKDLITKLCEPDPLKRIGNLKGGASEVRSHPWFKDLDFDKMYRRELKGPIIPQLRGHVCLVENILGWRRELTGKRRMTRETLKVTMPSRNGGQSTHQTCTRSTTPCLSASNASRQSRTTLAKGHSRFVSTHPSRPYHHTYIYLSSDIHAQSLWHKRRYHFTITSGGRHQRTSATIYCNHYYTTGVARRI